MCVLTAKLRMSPACSLPSVSLQAWNAGQAAGAAGELQQAAVLMAECGELYAALPAPSQVALHKRKVGR